MNHLTELCKVSEFYGGQIIIDHPASSILMPSNQLFASALLGFLNVPENLQGLYYMRPIADYLIKIYSMESQVKLSNTFEEIYTRFWESVVLTADESNFDGLDILNERTRGFRQSYPVYAFLFIASSHGGAPKIGVNSILKSFLSFAPYFFRKINEYRAQGYSEGFITHLCLAARKLVVANEYVIVRNHFNPTRYEKEQISRSALLDSDMLSDSIFEPSNRTYVFDLLFREGRVEGAKCKHERSAGEVTGRWQNYEKGLRIETPIELPEGLTFDRYFRITNKRKKWKIPELVDLKKFGVTKSEVRDVGETMSDYIDEDGMQIPAEFFIDPWKSKRNENQKQESMVFSSQSLPWGKDVVSKALLRLIFISIRKQNKAVASIIYLSLLMGLKETQLKKIHCNKLPNDRDNEEDVDKIESSFKGFNYDVEEKVLWDFNSNLSRDENNYLKLDPDNQIKLPQIILDSLPVVEVGTPLFSANDFKQTKAFLKGLGRDGISDISLSRLVITFEAFFIHSFGLPILYADMLSGTKRYYLKSQHYYVSQNQKHHNDQWLKFCKEFLNEYAEQTLVTLRNPPPNTFASARFKLSDSAVHIGAANTPSRQKLKKHFAWLYSQFPHTREELLHGEEYQWNAYIAYLYSMFSVCTGQRPLRDPIPSTQEISFEKGIIHITDKNSRSHREERCVPFANILKESFWAHKELNRDWWSKIITEGKYQTPKAAGFLPIIDSDMQIVAASTKSIDAAMSSRAGKAYILEIKNGFRHFLLTTLFQAGVDQADIDWISGHRSKNMEPESIYSSVSWCSQADKIKKIIDDEIVMPLEMELPFV